MRAFLIGSICFIVLCSMRVVAEKLRLSLQHLWPESRWQRRATMGSHLVRAVATSWLYIVSVLLVLQALGW